MESSFSDQHAARIGGDLVATGYVIDFKRDVNYFGYDKVFIFSSYVADVRCFTESTTFSFIFLQYVKVWEQTMRNF